MSIEAWNNVGKSEPTEEDMARARAIYEARWGSQPYAVRDRIAKGLPVTVVYDDDVEESSTPTTPTEQTAKKHVASRKSDSDSSTTEKKKKKKKTKVTSSQNQIGAEKMTEIVQVSEEKYSVGDIVIVARDSFHNNFIAKIIKINDENRNAVSCAVEYDNGVREDVQIYSIRHATLEEKKVWSTNAEINFDKTLDQLLVTMNETKKVDLIMKICKSMK